MRSLTLAIAAALLATPATAEMIPLSDILSRDEGSFEAGYPWVRCAALYTGMERYAGVNLGPDILEFARNAAEQNITIAAMLRIEAAERRGFGETDLQKQVDQAIFEVEPMMNAYVERFRVNYSARGSFMEGDPVSMGDYSVCGELMAAVLGN